jgi:hypothetical protein
MTPPRRFRCRCCGIVLPAWYAVPGVPNGAMLLQHMSQSHPAELRPYLVQMEVSKERIPFLANLRERQKWRFR